MWPVYHPPDNIRSDEEHELAFRELFAEPWQGLLYAETYVDRLEHAELWMRPRGPREHRDTVAVVLHPNLVPRLTLGHKVEAVQLRFLHGLESKGNVPGVYRIKGAGVNSDPVR